MFSSVVRRRAGSPRRQAVGLPGNQRDQSRRHEAAAGKDQGGGAEVYIRWKPILQEVVVGLEGTDLIFSVNTTTDAMCEGQASFKLPANSSRLHCETVSAIGNRCFSPCEAESEAAAAVLQRLASGPWYMCFMDISQLRCEELKMRSEKVLATAGEVHLVLCSFLSEWTDCIRQMDETYGSLSHENDGMESTIKEQFGSRLLAARLESHSKLNVLYGKAKTTKGYKWKSCNSMRKYFGEVLAAKADSERTYSRMRRTKISMRTILFEMMISLGWEKPNPVVRCVGELWGCELVVDPKGPYAVTQAERTNIESGNESSEADAIESAARKAILYLEEAMSIHLVDLNYNKRAQAEGFLVEAETVLEAISSLGIEARSDWAALLDDLSSCAEHLYNSALKHKPQDHHDMEHNTKWQCAETAAQLYESCAAVFLQACERKATISKWLMKE